MTAISERYAKLAGQMADRLAAVPADRWDAPTPCDGWTACDVLDHLVETPSHFFGQVGIDPPPPGPDRGEDPVGAFRQVSDAVQAGLEDPAVAGKGYDSPMGPQTFEGAIDKFLCGDLVIHQWDLARATGQDERLDADEVSRLQTQLTPLDEVLRSPGAFGPKVEPPADADEQTRLLCFLGRQV